MGEIYPARSSLVSKKNIEIKVGTFEGLPNKCLGDFLSKKTQK